ncbi:MAG: HpcH/HpaI aldolase family protein [Halanaerobiales bacterium]
MGNIDFNLSKSKIGLFNKICDPAIVEIAGYAGFDFIIIDMEHGPTTYENAQDLIRAAENSGIKPIIRVESNDNKKILRALDIGAHGVEVPDINNKEEAQHLVESSYFAPKGSRGVCRFVRSAKYSSIKKNYYNKANDKVLTIAHIEGEKGIKNIDEILTIQDLDIIFIGPYDLSQSLGFPGATDHPEVIKRMEQIVDLCNKKNKVVGTFVETIEDAHKWEEAGVRYLAYSVDVGLVYDKFLDVVNKIKKRGNI